LGGVCVCSDDGRMGKDFYIGYLVSSRDECESIRYRLVVRHGEEYGYVECRYIE
jgi:hypothetical protein